MFDKLSEDQRQALNIVREGHNLFYNRPGWYGLEEQLPSIKYFFSRIGWLWANDVSVPRKITSGLPGWFFFVQYPGLIFLAAR